MISDFIITKGHVNDFFKQYEELTIKFEKQEETLKEINKLIKSLNYIIESLNNTVEPFLQFGNVEEKIIEINKNKANENKRYIEKIVIDIKITKEIKRYRYYPDKNGKYNIPKLHNQNIQYGSTVKVICVDLMDNLYNSTDGVTRFIEDITNGGMTISKGTLIL